MDLFDGAFMKENFWPKLERGWAEDCSLEKSSESFGSGEQKTRKDDLVLLGDIKMLTHAYIHMFGHC